MSQGVKWCITAQEGMSGQRMRSGLSSMFKMETHRVVRCFIYICKHLRVEHLLEKILHLKLHLSESEEILSVKKKVSHDNLMITSMISFFPVNKRKTWQYISKGHVFQYWINTMDPLALLWWGLLCLGYYIFHSSFIGTERVVKTLKCTLTISFSVSAPVVGFILSVFCILNIADCKYKLLTS